MHAAGMHRGHLAARSLFPLLDWDLYFLQIPKSIYLYGRAWIRRNHVFKHNKLATGPIFSEQCCSPVLLDDPELPRLRCWWASERMLCLTRHGRGECGSCVHVICIRKSSTQRSYSSARTASKRALARSERHACVIDEQKAPDSESRSLEVVTSLFVQEPCAAMGFLVARMLYGLHRERASRPTHFGLFRPCLRRSRGFLALHPF